MKQAVITGVAGFLPEKIMHNKDLESIVETNDQWIRERTGIVERHIQEDGKGVSDMAVPAVLELLEKTGTKPEEVDLVVCCTVTADFNFPDTGTLICHKAGLKNAYGYDLAAACSGFLFGLQAAAQYVKAETYKKVIVVGGDKMTSILDYQDRTTCILFGDGAAAVMLEPSDDEALGVKEAVLHSDGSGQEDLYQLGGGSVHPASVETVEKRMHYVRQNGRTVFKRAVMGMSGAVKDVLAKAELASQDINWVVPHQANIRIIESVCNQLDFDMDRVMVNIEKYGNTTAATIPLCLRDYEGQLKKGDHLILTAFGGGYTWGAIHLVWGYDGKK